MKTMQIRGGAGDVTQAAPNTRAQDNLYLAVNSDWIEHAEIPADHSGISAFQVMADDLEKQLMADFAGFAKGEQLPDVPNFAKAVELYKLALDFDKRNKEGAKPIKPDFELLSGILDFADYNLKAADLYKAGLGLPFSISVEPDMKNTKVNALYTAGPSTVLPDTTQYGTEAGDKLLAVYEKQTANLLHLAGVDESKAADIAAKAVAYDKEIAKFVKSNEEWADYPAIYNPMKTSDFVAKFKSFKMQYFLENIFGKLPERVIVEDPRYLDNAESLLNQDHFAEIKSWLLAGFINGAASSLSEDFRNAAFPFRQALSGARELPNHEKFAYRTANGMFSEVVGVYYGQKYFGEAAKKDVEDMVKKMLAIYEERLSKNDWLSEATKKQAIVKLQALRLKIGYPDKIEKIYDRLTISPEASLYYNQRSASQELIAYNIEQLNREVDRDLWAMPGNLVNACYDPSRNDLTFPAAILQKPFYSKDQSRADNYGGIGTVIGHEVSHAFDNNGAQFDEFGNMKKWWTEADYAEFKKRTQQEIDLFDGIQYGAGKLNGKQIVSENIADQGGLTVALEALKGEQNTDLKSFYENFARVWATKDTPQIIQTLLALDVHAPGPLRANVQSQCQEDFYQVFGVKEGDGMYLEPEKRVVIW